MAGHLFVTLGDIRRLACTAWLLPTAGDLTIEAPWRRGAPRIDRALDQRRDRTAIADPDDWLHGSRVARMLPPDGPSGSVWLGNIGGSKHTELDWIVKPVEAFVRRAAREEPMPNRDVRDRPLLAIPFIGTGKGGKRRSKGDVARALVALLDPVLAEVDVDVAVVLRSTESFAALQHARRSYWASGWDRRWSHLLAAHDADDMMPVARELAEHARRRRLVLFVGAGISAGAGLPQWNGLLRDLATEAKIEDKSFDSLGALDKATVIETALRGQGKSLGAAVQRKLPDGPYALAHTLIASLPTDEVVTTNYDRLLEKAAADAERPFTVLDRPVADAERWLLKLHGDLDRPEEIVLSRDDYLGYGQRRAALRGIVQAMLITRHMVFLGFGMSDDNFHAILHDVRTALATRQGRVTAFGTALLVQRRPLFDQLWRGDIRPAALAADFAPIGIGARRLEVLLDFVLAESAGALAHFMDASFAGLLTPSERQLRAQLVELFKNREDGSPVWKAFEDFLTTLGMDTASRSSDGASAPPHQPPLSPRVSKEGLSSTRAP